MDDDEHSNASSSSSCSWAQKIVFPYALHDMLVAAIQANNPSVRFSEDGKAFMIYPEKTIPLGNIMEKHLKHRKYISLERTLELYGWKHHTTGKYKGMFHHPLYHQSRPNLEDILQEAAQKYPDTINTSVVRGKTTSSGASAKKRSAPTKKGKPSASTGKDAAKKPARKSPPRRKKPPVADKDAMYIDDESQDSVDSPNEDEEEDPEASNEVDAPPETSKPLFRVAQKVLCRDNDGLLYQSIIRRGLYGKHYHKQAHIGQADTEEEIDAIRQSGHTPTWHYFVHFMQWKSNWDRWVVQDDILELNDSNLEWMHNLSKAHRALQQEFRQRHKSSSAKKSFQRIDGGDFLRAWKRRLDQLERDRSRGKPIIVDAPFLLTASNMSGELSIAKVKAKAPDTNKQLKRLEAQNKRWLEREVKLRRKDLGQSDDFEWAATGAVATHKKGFKKSKLAETIVMPFSLKKCLVEEWEIICQCGMVPRLPCPITVRHALEFYLRSKGVFRPTAAESDDEKDAVTSSDREVLQKVAGMTPTTPSAACDTTQTAQSPIKFIPQTGQWQAFSASDTLDYPALLGVFKTRQEAVWAYEMAKERQHIQAESKADNNDDEQSAAATIDKPAESDDGHMEDDAPKSAKTPENGTVEMTNKQMKAMRNKEWIDMVEGIAIFFDQALLFRLLYRQEIPQHRVIEEHEELSSLRKSDVYGCEHLLRLFLRLPVILNDHYSGDDTSVEDEEECKRIMARVNDLVRFLHKHQDTLFCGLYRKKDEAENREITKMQRLQERTKKRKMAQNEVDGGESAKKMRVS